MTAPPLPAPTWRPAPPDAHVALWLPLRLTATAYRAPDGTWVATASRVVGRRTLRRRLVGIADAERAKLDAAALAGELAAVGT